MSKVSKYKRVLGNLFFCLDSNAFIHYKLHFYSLSLCMFLCREQIGLVLSLLSVAFWVYVVYSPYLDHLMLRGLFPYKAARLNELDVVSRQFSGSLNVENPGFFQKSLCCTWADGLTRVHPHRLIAALSGKLVLSHVTFPAPSVVVLTFPSSLL